MVRERIIRVSKDEKAMEDYDYKIQKKSKWKKWYYQKNSIKF